MAEVRAFRALHYNQAAVSSLGDVVAPPYDVIDEEQRQRLVERSPFNVVEIDLPVGGEDRYARAAENLEAWTLQGVLSADREPAIWALSQDYKAPDGAWLTRRGFLCAVRLAPYGEGIRPHERTQPGPKQDRLELTRATRHNTSPIFALHEGRSWDLIEPALGEEPWGEVTDEDGIVHRVWRVGDSGIHRAVAERLAEAELLIADGHHRYETALAYEREVGGEGAHSHTLMCLVSLEDPGLTVFPTHRLLSNLGGSAVQESLGAGLKRLFDVSEVAVEDLAPAAEEDVGVFGYVDAHLRRGFRLRLKDPAEADRALAGRSDAYRRLDAAILEALVLRELLGMTEDEIAAKRGIAYAASVDEVNAALDGGGCHAAFLLRPTPVETVRQVAAAGETMPPKSTYFFPKLLSGLVFNPLS
jgi:uncharacterized protein (DUF1015 family)